MASIDPEGKWKWYLKCEYGVYTVWRYLELGAALGMVQVRHAFVGLRLMIYFFTEWLLCIFAGSAAESVAEEATEQAAQSYSKPQHQLLVAVFRELAALVRITHGEAVDVNILRLLRNQARAISDGRARRASLGVTVESTEDVLFQLSEVDPQYAKAVESGRPVALTFDGAVQLITRTSEVLAWQAFLLSSLQRRQSSNGEAAVSAEPHPTVQPFCVAVMLPNSVEYNALCLACTRCGPLNTFLHELYRGPCFQRVPDARGAAHTNAGAVYHLCATALINTNLTTNAMVYHALECAGAAIIVLDAVYAPLLFVAEADARGQQQQPGPALQLRVPPSVKRILLWRHAHDGPAGGRSAALTDEMLRLLADFHRQNYADVAEAVASFSPALSANIAASSAATELDLHALVSAGMPAHTTGGSPAELSSAEVTRDSEAAAAAFPLLIRNIKANLPAWLSSDAEGTAFAQVNGATAAGPQRSPTETLHRQCRCFSKRLAAALACFRPTQPMLFIYTSGTTGLPKAARFSHLRFFATAFLSRVLRMRRKTEEVIRAPSQRRTSPRTPTDVILGMLYEVVLLLVQCLGLVLGLGRWRRYTDAELAVEAELSQLTIYNCLPMYHTVGCVFCLGHLMHALDEQQQRQRELRSAWRGLFANVAPAKRAALPVPSVRMVIRSKFSASTFRDDLVRYRVTIAQYIGEILRYAVLHERRRVGGGPAAAKAADTPEWRVPYLFGNGLRLDIWEECKQRLRVEQPVEFYSSTEGNIFLFNLFDIPGVVGHVPYFPGPLYILSMQFLPIFPFRVVRFDEDAQRIWRDPQTGYGALARPGEVGEVLGEIIQGFDLFALRRFDGYHDSANPSREREGQRKVVRHVVWPFANDAFFCSGDLLRLDGYGFCTFVDRTGDTFRWKGENVSTTEVSNTLNTVRSADVGLREAVVYGVTIGEREGRAGMALLVLDRCHKPEAGASPPSLQEERLFLQNYLYAILSGRISHLDDGSANTAILPAYAIPLVLRVIDADEDDDDDDDKEAKGEAANAAQDTAVRTTTFKYRKNVLVKEGYAGAASVVDADTLYREEATADARSRPSSRYYVLVTKPNLLKEFGQAPWPPENCQAGYIPLTAHTLQRVGDDLRECGW